jgi:hypothetical protein
MRSIRAMLSTATMLAVLLGPAVLPGAAQEPSADAKPAPSPSVSTEARRGTRPGDVQRVFVLKNVRAEEMAKLLSVFPADISHISLNATQTLGVSAAPAVVAAIEETIKRLDVPPPLAKSVDVAGYVLECSTKGAEGDGAPAELQDVVAQLRRTFGYAGCGLGTTLFARAAAGNRFDTSARWTSVREGGMLASGTYSLQAGRVTVDSPGETPVIRFTNLRVMRDGPSYSGDIDVRNGQRVVVGKLGTVETGRDLIFVLTAKVVD